MAAPQATEPAARLTLVRLGIDTYREFVIYMNRDCPICRSEGFVVRSRIAVRLGDRSIVATLNVVDPELLAEDRASLSESAWSALEARPGDIVELAHPAPLRSESFLRKKVYGGRLEGDETRAIVQEIAGGLYDDIHLAAFITAGAGKGLDLQETIDLTAAMIEVGQRLDWPWPIVADKHSVGGLPGNRTTMIVVPIVAAAGLAIPKTSSRAITSPAGTADAMETLAPVDLDLPAIRRVVEREGGCIAWGGSVRLSPADDILIGVERPLDLDSEGQLVASILSKKIAAGSTHVVLDLPVGPTAKLRDTEAARALGERLEQVARAFGLSTVIHFSDGRQPVGRGIGPALEARDVLSVLTGAADAPQDLRDRALALAGHLLELTSGDVPRSGRAQAEALLDSGAAWAKFQAICEAQGGLRTLAQARFRRDVTAPRAGAVVSVHNRRLAKVAKLAGAPRAALAGVDFLAPLGARVEAGQTLFTLHAETRSELDYATAYLAASGPIVTLAPEGRDHAPDRLTTEAS